MWNFTNVYIIYLSDILYIYIKYIGYIYIDFKIID